MRVHNWNVKYDGQFSHAQHNRDIYFNVGGNDRIAERSGEVKKVIFIIVVMMYCSIGLAAEEQWLKDLNRDEQGINLDMAILCSMIEQGNHGNFVKGYMYGPEMEVEPEALAGTLDSITWSYDYVIDRGVSLDLDNKEGKTIKQIIHKQKMFNALLFVLVVAALIL